MSQPPDEKSHHGESESDQDSDLIAKALEQARAARGQGVARSLEASNLRIPGYRIVSEVHRGGQGVVYKAIQDGTRRTVALKLMLRGAFAGDRERARFEREIRVLSQIRHPGIVSIYESGEVDGRVFYVMEYVSGKPLDEYLRHAQPSLRAKLDLFASICEALHAAHLQGVIHRDLKPDNIRIDPSGTPHILDFGLAKVAGAMPENDDGQPVMMTATGQFVGSLPWASPEQAEGIASRVDIRTDVYSMGVILYQVLTNNFPYAVEGTTREILTTIVEAAPKRPRSVDRSIPSEVETITLRALSKDRDRRYQSAGELARDVRRFLSGQPILARSDSLPYILRKSLDRHRVAAASILLAVMLIVGFGISMTVLWNLAAHRGDQLELALKQRDADLDYVLDLIFGGDDLRQFARDRTVRDVVDELSASADDRFEGDPVRQATLHEMLGRSYRAFAAPEMAIPHLRRSLAVRIQHFGDHHDLTLGTRNTLAEALKDQGSFSESIVLYEQIEVALRATGTPDAISRRRLATVLSNRGRLLEQIERTVEARQAMAEAIDLLSRDPGDDLSRRIALFARGHAAGVDSKIGMRQDAAIAMEAIHSSINQAFGANHPATITSAAKLSGLLLDCGRSEEAYQLLSTIPPVAVNPESVILMGRAIAIIYGTEAALDHLAAHDFTPALELYRAQILIDAGRRSEAGPILERVDATNLDDRLAFEHALLAIDAASSKTDRETSLRLLQLAAQRFETQSPQRLLTAAIEATVRANTRNDHQQVAEALTAIKAELAAACGHRHRFVVRADIMRAAYLAELGRSDQSANILKELHQWAVLECGRYHPLTRRITTALDP